MGTDVDYNQYKDTNRVSLADMLDARERRAVIQQRLIATYKCPVISFTLNIPGNIKMFPLARRAFNEGLLLINRQLKRYKAEVLHFEEVLENTGCEGFFAVDFDAAKLKACMQIIEDTLAIGRVFDIDIIDTDGTKLDRSSPRNCLICDKDARICARSSAHATEEVFRAAVKIMEDYFNNAFAEYMAALASKALLYEVATSPKPGLVDRANNGSHNDMDFLTFIDSSTALTSYFRLLTLRSITSRSRADSASDDAWLFAQLRYLGMEAEDTMLSATGGVNTHKGLIFSMGVICAAAGVAYGSGLPLTLDSVLSMSADISRAALTDLSYVTTKNAASHGEKIFAEHGVTGIRGEAASGFINVRRHGLPVLRELIEQHGCSINDAGAMTLLNLLAEVTDTNLINRCGIAFQNEVHTEIKKLLAENKSPDDLLKKIKPLDDLFIIKNASPGGCADLLAVTYMLYFSGWK